MGGLSWFFWLLNVGGCANWFTQFRALKQDLVDYALFLFFWMVGLHVQYLGSW